MEVKSWLGRTDASIYAEVKKQLYKDQPHPPGRGGGCWLVVEGRGGLCWPGRNKLHLLLDWRHYTFDVDMTHISIAVADELSAAFSVKSNLEIITGGLYELCTLGVPVHQMYQEYKDKREKAEDDYCRLERDAIRICLGVEVGV